MARNVCDEALPSFACSNSFWLPYVPSHGEVGKFHLTSMETFPPGQRLTSLPCQDSNFTLVVYFEKKIAFIKLLIAEQQHCR